MSFIGPKDFKLEIAKASISGHGAVRKFGRNPTSASGAIEFVWTGSGTTYPWMDNFGAGDTMDSVSADAQDAGASIRSGTATGGSTTTLVDSGEDFTAATTVAVGDYVLNDTNSQWGRITNVTATTLTHEKMTNNPVGSKSVHTANESGDSYRVVDFGAGGTGAQVIKIAGLDASYAEQEELVIMNGATPVESSGTYMRLNRAFAVIAGSTENNVGLITIDDNGNSVGTQALIPATEGQTLMAIYTVPAGKSAYLYKYYMSALRAVAAGVSANIHVHIRTFDKVERMVHITGISRDGTTIGGHEFNTELVIDERTDIYLQAEPSAAADVSGGFDLILVDE